MPFYNGQWIPDLSGTVYDPTTGLRTPLAQLARASLSSASQVGNLPAGASALGAILPANLQGPQSIYASVPNVIDTTGTMASDVAAALGSATTSAANTARAAVSGFPSAAAAAGAGGGTTAEQLALELGIPAAGGYSLFRGRGGGPTAPPPSEPPTTGGGGGGGGGPTPPETPPETPTPPGGPGGIKGAFNPYSIYPAIAAYGINQALPSTGTAGNIRQVLADALSGAAAGGAAGGMTFTPFGPVAGAVGGAVLGAARGLGDILFGSPDQPKPTTDQLKTGLSQNAQRLGLANPDQYSQLFDTYKGLVDDKGQKVTDEAAADKVNNLIISDYQTAQANAKSTAQAQAQTAANAQAIMAIQSQANDYFQPYANNLIQSGYAEADALKGLASTLPPQYASLFNNQAEQVIAQNNRLGNAYMLQATLAPSLQLAQMSQDQQTQYENQQVRLAQIQAALQKGGSTASNTNLNTLINPNQANQANPYATAGSTG